MKQTSDSAGGLSSDGIDRRGIDRRLLARRIRVARGQEPGDLLLTGGQVVNVFTGELQSADVVIADGWIAGVGDYSWTAQETVDVSGRFLLPGLIDAHMHVESTLLWPDQLARLVVPRGTTAIVADPHEIANVMGTRGIDLLLSATEGLPLDVFFMAPSCVPAVAWEDNGATLDADDIAGLLGRPRILGLAEVMDFPAVLGGADGVLDKVVVASEARRPIDGHAPGVVGQDIVAYAAAGIRSDHESTDPDEALAKARLGMLVQVREGSSAHNLDTLLPLMAQGRLGRWCLATDDVHPDDLLNDGHLDYRLARVVAGGVPAVEAVRHATWVPAQHYGLQDRGAVAPSFRADLCIVGDLTGFRPQVVVKNGRIVARDGSLTATIPDRNITPENSVRLGPVDEDSFRLPLEQDDCPVIGIVPDQLITRRETHPVARENGEWVFDASRDIVMAACIERHRATGKIGLGLVRGFGLTRHGAIGSSVAHDSHNLIVAGTNPRDMLACVQELAQSGGGFVVATDGQIAARLPLQVAGLLSTDPFEQVVEGLDEIQKAVQTLGCPLHAAFVSLSFLALPVIPELRVTARGLYDVIQGDFVTLGAAR